MLLSLQKSKFEKSKIFLKKLQKSKTIIFSLLLLIFFPFWLESYVGGVKNNSDSADLTIYPMPGLIIWAVILILNLWTLLKHYSKSKKP